MIVAEERGERIGFIRRGKQASAHREKMKAGKFVKKERVTKVMTSTADFPMPLMERDPIHTILVVASPGQEGDIMSLVVSAAEAGNGEVFNIAYGDPSFEARLVEAPFGAGEAGDFLASMGSAGEWGSWAAGSVTGALKKWLKSRLAMPGPV